MDLRLPFQKVDLPRPLVSEISVYSPPPKPKQQTVDENLSVVEKMPLKNLNAKKPPPKFPPFKNCVSTKPTTTALKPKADAAPVDMTELKTQLKKQNSEIAELKKQNAEIVELKKLLLQVLDNSEVLKPINVSNQVKNLPIEVKNLPASTNIETTSSRTPEDRKTSDKQTESKNLAAATIEDGQRVKVSSDFNEKRFCNSSTQTDKLICPHCEKSFDASPQRQKRQSVSDKLKAANQQRQVKMPEHQVIRRPPEHQYKPPEHQMFQSDDSDFVEHDENLRINPSELSMLDQACASPTPDSQLDIDQWMGAAQKWAQPSGQLVRPRDHSNANVYRTDHSKDNVYRVDRSLIPAEPSYSVNEEVSCLTNRYLPNRRIVAANEQRRMTTVSPSGHHVALTTRRQMVTMESEVSLIGMVPTASLSEVSISSQEFLRRHGLAGAKKCQSNNTRYVDAHRSDMLSVISERSGESNNCCHRNDCSTAHGHRKY